MRINGTVSEGKGKMDWGGLYTSLCLLQRYRDIGVGGEGSGGEGGRGVFVRGGVSVHKFACSLPSPFCPAS